MPGGLGKALIGRVVDKSVFHKLPTFLLHLLACSLGSMNRIEMFELISKYDYGPITSAMRNVVSLMKLGFTQARACEIVAEQTASRHISSFLRRFAKVVRTGESIRDFLRSEYETFMARYYSSHQRSMDVLRRLSEAYVATLSSGVLVFITLVMTAMLLNLPSVVFWSALLLICVSNTAIAIALYGAAPPANVIWASPKSGRALMLKAAPILVLSFASSAMALPLVKDHHALLMAISGLPCLAYGIIALRLRTKTKSLDEAFPQFLTTLCASLKATGTTIRSVMGDIGQMDFGPLSKPVRWLRARLEAYVEEKRCWNLFKREAGSDIIKAHVDILTDALSSGAPVGDVEELIVSSVMKMLDMRKRREEVAAFLRGILIPLHVVLCSLMAMIASIISAFLEFVSAMGQYSPTLGVLVVAPPVPIGLYFYIAISALTIVNSVAAAVVEGDTKLTLAVYLGILALGGAAYHITYMLFESLMRSIWAPRLPLQPIFRPKNS